MAILDKVTSNLNQTDLLQAALWSVAFVGVCVLVALGKVDTTMLQNLLFALVGGLAMKERKSLNAPPSE